MNIFSRMDGSSHALQGLVPQAFWGIETPRGDQQKFRKVLARQSPEIDSMMETSEKLTQIFPSFIPSTGYNGMGVLTSHQLFKLSSRSKKQIPLTEIFDVKHLVHDQGYSILEVVSTAAAPFAEFASVGVASDEALKYIEGTISLYTGNYELAELVFQMLRAAWYANC